MPGKNSKHPRPRSSRRAPLLRQAPPMTPSLPLLGSLIQSHNHLVALVTSLSLQVPRSEHASIPGFHRGRGGEWTKNKKHNRRKRKTKKKSAIGSHGAHVPSASPPPPSIPTSPLQKMADQVQSWLHSTMLPASSSSSSSSLPLSSPSSSSSGSMSLLRNRGEDEYEGRCPNCQYITDLSGGLGCCAECLYCGSMFVLSDYCQCVHYKPLTLDMSDPNWASQIPTESSHPRREVLGRKRHVQVQASSFSSGATPSKKPHAESKTSTSTPSSYSGTGGATSTSITAPPQWRVLHSEPSNPIQNHGPNDPLVWKDF